MCGWLSDEMVFASLEARAPLGIRCEFRRQDFHRDAAIEAYVARAIDLAHAAGAEWRDDLVRTQLGAWRECQCVVGDAHASPAEYIGDG
jgi:hypothetical protein